MINPYRGRPTRAFWKAAVAQRHLADIDELWAPMALTPADRIATAGSCFAQHIGQALARRGAHFLDCEPPPPIFADTEEARRFGYRVFSCRYGNVYTARQMRQLAEEALGLRPRARPCGSARAVFTMRCAPASIRSGRPACRPCAMPAASIWPPCARCSKRSMSWSSRSG
jgi:hypothetical protein